MRLSMWTYPWDILDVGFDTAIAELRDCGLNCISLATSYHAGRFFQPRSPLRKAYFPEDGTIYFSPDARLWQGKRIVPKVADLVTGRGDVLRDLAERRDATGLGVSCWTVCLHNTRLGMLHPDAVTRNAFGDPNFYNLCPSNPDARDYVITLVEDLTRNYKPDTVELESPCFMGFAHEFHHEKDGVGLTPEDDYLLSLCFCPSCLTRSAKAGVDGAAAQRIVRGLIEDTARRERPAPRWPDFAARGKEVFRDFPAVYDYVMWRFEPVTSLIAGIRERADPMSKIVLIDLAEGWLGGCDHRAIGQAADGLLLCVYGVPPERVRTLVAAGRAAIGPGKFLGAGYRVFYPEVTGPDDLAAKSVAAAGVDGLNYYNYGLIPAARLAWVRQAVEAASG